MRIKSYFAPSVQSAIALARKEFGDAVTLVTSHVAAPENRTLGEYEVVFAIEEPKAVAPVEVTVPVSSSEKSAATPPPFSAFQDLLLQAVSARPSTQEKLPEKLASLRFSLMELGMEAASVIQVMGLIEQLIGIDSSHQKPVHSSKPQLGAEMAAVQISSLSPVVSPSPQAGLSTAELLFAESVTQVNWSEKAQS